MKPHTQNNATNAWNYNSQANNNNKNNSYYVLPVFDYRIVTKGFSMCAINNDKMNNYEESTTTDMMREYVPIELIDQGYRDCCKHKGGTWGCIEYKMDFISNNYQLYKELNSMTYEIGVSKAFCVTRPKLREVWCATFKDRCVHHILAIKFLSIFEGYMTDNTYACRKGKGVDYGINHLREQIEAISEDYTKETWILKCDLSGFFMSIDRGLLYNIVEDIIRKEYHEDDIEFWLWLWKKVIMNDPTKNCTKVGDLSLFGKLPENKSLFTNGEGKGLPIGNLPSQILANLLMGIFDKWIMARLGNGSGYGRYVDDFVCISRDKQLLLNTLEDARAWLKVNLGLTLHPNKVYLQEARKGVQMTGAIIKPHRVYTINRTKEHLFGLIKRWNELDKPTSGQVRAFACRCNSLLGLMIRRDTYAIRWQAWRMMRHKDIVYCQNMRKIGIRSSYYNNDK